MAGFDKVAVLWIIAANLLAGGMMYQRLDKMGYIAPIKQRAAAVIEPVLESLGLFHANYQQCGLQDSTMFIITSSRVVHPDGVRPGASKFQGRPVCSALRCAVVVAGGRCRLQLLHAQYTAAAPVCAPCRRRVPRTLQSQSVAAALSACRRQCHAMPGTR